MARKLKHSLFTVIAQIDPGRREPLVTMLEAKSYLGTPQSNDVFAFGDLEQLHYASMFTYDDPEDGELFVLELNVDHTPEKFFDDFEALLDQNNEALEQWVSVCDHLHGYFGGAPSNIRRFFEGRVQKPSTPYVGAVGLSRDQIRLDQKVFEVVDQTLGGGANGRTFDQLTQDVLTNLKNDPATAAFADPIGDGGHKLGVLGWIGNGVAGVASLLGHAILGVINLYNERKAPEHNLRQNFAQVREQTAFEDHSPTNHMASIVFLHKDAARNLAKRNVYSLLNRAIRLFFNNGVLGGIETIHFAHWAIVNQGRRLLFVSNYDGTWDSYLDDFTLKANEGLTLAWAHGVGFPRSLLMVGGGAAYGPEFIDWARRSMTPCPVWYSAYPGLSIKRIIENRDLRRELASGGSNKDWLKHV